MVIIQLAGGLGNQMFQYALYLQLKSLGKIVKIDDVSGFVQDAQRDQALKYFDIEYERPTAEELILMLDSSMLPWARVRRKLFGRKKKSYFEADKRYHPEIMEWDDIYLEGYWQTEKYFAKVAQEVREAYNTDRLFENVCRHMCAAERKQEIPECEYESDVHLAAQGAGARTLEDYLSQISATESVSVHVRRGDYLLPENRKLFGGICTETYYRKAMARMRREHPGCTFYIFTNDKQWIRERIDEAVRAETDEAGEAMRAEQDEAKAADRALDEAEIIDGVETAEKSETADCAEVTARFAASDRVKIVDLPETAGTADQQDYAEFALMSKCRHHILANSSYSWWASYLCGNPDKTVLAPDRWLNGWDCTDIYRDDMQRVQADGMKGIGDT